MILLAACTPTAKPTLLATEHVLQLVTPVVPEGAGFFDGCTHMVGYPPEFTTDGAGILFETQDPQISFYINIRRRTEIEQGLSLEELVSHVSKTYSSQSPSQELRHVMLTDFLGQELKGLITDIVTSRGMHVRLLILVRPETLLMDMVKDDVVYELVAQAPGGDWVEWESHFEIFFESFRPIECGGV
ncbi:MAG: hypothetical protein A2Z14_10930 [Chloroflexi bacterium RBG_16_48_8]|nr:MAG: hypothetical protein A2Z14_10930 [Chloroflexi bacterium RBG_16_48_8]